MPSTYAFQHIQYMLSVHKQSLACACVCMVTAYKAQDNPHTYAVWACLRPYNIVNTCAHRCMCTSMHIQVHRVRYMYAIAKCKNNSNFKGIFQLHDCGHFDYGSFKL